MQIVNDWEIFDFKRHPFFSLANEIDTIIKPLNTYFALNSFNYFKTYNDGSQIRLTNTPSWVEYYLRNRLYLQSIFELLPHNYIKSCMIWSNIDTHGNVLSAASEFGINYGITFVKPCFDGCEFYFLGTINNDKTVINKYLSNLSLVEKFVDNFKVLGRELLNKIEPARLMIGDYLENNLSYPKLSPISRIKFLSSISGYNFTKRELDCIDLILNGYTAKQIAEKLSISYRTVEVYWDNLKQKTNTTSKHDLIKFLAEKFNI